MQKTFIRRTPSKTKCAQAARLSTFRRGYTLVEVVIASLIVGGILVGALNVLGGSLRTSRVASAKLDDPGLGHQLMAEILAQPYEDPEEPGGPIGLETGETNTTRTDFDDLDDYNNWIQNPPETKDGAVVSGASGWQRIVFVKHFDPSSGNTIPTETGVKLITVKIVPSSGIDFELNALRSQWGSLQQQPAMDGTVVTSVDGQLQIGSSGIPVRAATPLQNHAYEP
ncbi:prepilin-type N-terminal cleavage/methylation domain-containing protein [Pirellulales bacterium]|nr:prepilin-type N-terminal cleavage/methylation domain-containing protein [Pirellulales bacterium]